MPAKISHNIFRGYIQLGFGIILICCSAYPAWSVPAKIVAVDKNGQYISGVTASGSISAVFNGIYEFDLPTEFAINVSKTDWVFSPQSWSSDRPLPYHDGYRWLETQGAMHLGGRVRNSNGLGINGVTVTLSGLESGTRVTDAGGNYQFTNLALGNYTLSCSGLGYHYSSNQSGNYTTSQNNINFTGGCTIKGYIRDTAGTAISGVTLSLGGVSNTTVASAANGYYEFLLVSPGGDYTVTPSRPGFMFSSPKSYLSLGSDQIDQNFTAYYYIRGKATNSLGNGLAAVTVTLSGAASSVTSTASDGTFQFPNLNPGNYTVVPSKAGFTFSPASRTYSPITFGQDNQDFLYCFYIRGHIRHSNLAPIVNAAVNLTGTATSSYTTDANGFYEFVNLQPGEYYVTPSLGNFVFSPSTSPFISLNSNQDNQDFLGGYSVQGRISDNSNAGIYGVQISLTGFISLSVSSDTNGIYSLSGLPPGSYTTTPSKPGYIFDPLNKMYPSLSASQSSQNFNGTAAHYFIKGTVVDKSGKGISNISISLSGNASSSFTTDSNGYYEFLNLPYGSYQITPSRIGYVFDPPSMVFSDLNSNQNSRTFICTSQQTSIPSLKVLNGYINPVKGDKATIRWSQPQSGSVRITIFNMVGEKIITLFDQMDVTSGQYHEVGWDGRSENGLVVGSGIYIVHLISNDFETHGKIAVVK